MRSKNRFDFRSLPKRLALVFFGAIFLLFLIEENGKAQNFLDLNKDGKMDAYENPKLPVGQRVQNLISQMTLEEKISQLGSHAPAVPRLGIPAYDWWNECLHGVARAGVATVFPQAIGMAATWHQELIFRTAKAISDEARAKYHKAVSEGKHARYYGLTFWSPVVNLARDPRWGRTQETYGEDPYLTSRLGVAFVKGLQGNDPHYLKLVATPKHFAVNNEEAIRHTGSANVDERQLREYYLAQFEACVREGHAQSVMGAYNAVNGTPCCVNTHLLEEILRKEWGFDGYVVSDCGAIQDIFAGHKFLKSAEEAAAAGVKSGCDLNCGEVYQKHLLKAVRQNIISEKEIDRSLSRLFRARFRLGMFDPAERVPFSRISQKVIDSPQHRQLALQVARESIVLLKNENNFLPLRKTLRKIAVVGPTANTPQFGNYSGLASRAVSPLKGIRQKVSPKTEVLFGNGCPISDELLSAIPQMYLKPNATAKEHGLLAEYFDNKDLQGAPVLRRIEPEINFDWGGGSPDERVPADLFSARWTGVLIPPETGTYTLGVISDDGVRFYFKGKRVVDFWHDRAAAQDTIQVHLKANHPYSIRIDYFEDMGDAAAKLVWNYKEKGPNSEEAKALQLAKEADVVVAVMGLNQTLEAEEMDRSRIELPEVQVEFLKKLVEVNPKIVLVLQNGSPLAIPWCKAHIPAIVEAWYPGEEGGNALADVLFGDYNPGGRLPLTFYASTEQLPPMHDYDLTRGRTYMYLKEEPLFPFGFGLSYTSFEYKNLRLEKTTLDLNDSLSLSFRVKNTGRRHGDEVVQLYVRALHSKHLTQRKVLKAFRRIHLQAGKSRLLTFKIPVSALRYFDPSKKAFVTETGAFELQIGASSEDIRLRADFEITGEKSSR